MYIVAVDPGESTGLCLLQYVEGAKTAVFNTFTIPLSHVNVFTLLNRLEDNFTDYIRDMRNPRAPIHFVIETVVLTGKLNTDKFNQIRAFDRFAELARVFAVFSRFNSTTHFIAPEERKNGTKGIRLPRGLKTTHEKDALRQAMCGLARLGVDIDAVKFEHADQPFSYACEIDS